MDVDVTKLSKTDKIELWELLQEQKRRIREGGKAYVPNPGQCLVHNSPAGTRLVTCGNGAGKTTLGVNEAVWWATGYNPMRRIFTKVPTRIIFLLDHPEKVTDKILPEIRNWTTLKEDQLHKRGKPYVSRLSWPNGSEILFMFHDQTDLQFESIECDYIIFDEPPPRRVYVALYRGLRNKNRKPRVLILGTPITGSWMRKEIQQPWSRGELPDTECFTFGTDVNSANLADGYIESFSKVLSDKERAVRLHGQFFDLEGVALSHLFDRSVHVIDPFEWPSDYPTVVAIDPHPTKPHNACLLGCDKEGYLYYIKELRAKAVAKQFAQMLKDFMAGYRVIDIVHDSLGEAEGTGGEGFKSFSQVLRENGVLTRPTTWLDKNDEDFIERIRNALFIPEEDDNFGKRTPKLRIFSGNNGIVSDIENVQWVKMRDHDEFKPKLDITDKDFLSTLKYALASNLSPWKGKVKCYRPIIPAAERFGIGNNGNSAKAQFRKMTATWRVRNKKLEADEDW